MSRSRRDPPEAPGATPETPPAPAAEVPPEPPPPSEPVPAPLRPRKGWRSAASLGLVLALVIAMVLVSPWWAPAVAPLLPWGAIAADEAPAGAMPADREIVARLDRLEAAQRTTRPPSGIAAPDLRPALDRLDQRLAALEAKPVTPPPDLGDIRRQLGVLSAGIGDLTGRLGALEQAARAEPASDPADAALALTLLQIRAAIETARPFAAEYEVLAGLARNRPELAQAAAPLAEPATTGVASRAVLIRRLRDLAGRIAGAEPPPAADDFGGRIVARLRSLVTIRRVAGPGQTAAEAAVSTAEQAMARGDLAAAVAALDVLRGAPAEAALPWLRMARARLQTETALQHAEAVLAARLKAAARPADPPR